MTTFDWHIIRRLATGYVYLVVALIIFFILLHYLEYVDDFLDREAPMKVDERFSFSTVSNNSNE